MPDVQELQEARPQLPVPQGSLDVQEAVNPQHLGGGPSSDGDSLSIHGRSLICRGQDADNIKTSWPDSAQQSAILASEHLSSRCVASLLSVQRFHKRQSTKTQKTAPFLPKPALCWLPCNVTCNMITMVSLVAVSAKP